MLTITSFEQKYIQEAAGLFIRNFQALRRSVPFLPDNFEDPQQVAQRSRRPVWALPGRGSPGGRAPGGLYRLVPGG